MTWYKKAASLGETPAMFKLGMILWKGLLGQPRNPREGLTWLKRAADKADESNQHALHELGLLYSGDGNDVIIPDLEYARSLFTKAAELGYPASQFKMGCAFEYGLLGCQVDPRRSIAWYSKAAVKGDHEAQLALSGWYLTGSEGIIQQSDTEAYLWARKAAERGLAKAEYALGYYTEVGIGVRGDLEEAKRWYYKAASKFSFFSGFARGNAGWDKAWGMGHGLIYWKIGQQHPKAQARLQELKQGGAKVQKSRERLSRSNVNRGGKDEGDCVIM
jgi:TPR repeat protein